MNIFAKKNIDELQSSLIEEKRKLMSLRFMHAGSQLKNTSIIKKTRKSIAQIFTAITAITAIVVKDDIAAIVVEENKSA